MLLIKPKLFMPLHATMTQIITITANNRIFNNTEDGRILIVPANIEDENIKLTNKQSKENIFDLDNLSNALLPFERKK